MANEFSDTNVLHLIKQLIHQVVLLNQSDKLASKITAKSLSDAYIFMQILEIIDNKYFNTNDLSKPPVQSQQQMSRQKRGHLLLLGRVVKSTLQIPNESTQNNQINFQKQYSKTSNTTKLSLKSKIKNWKILIQKIKKYFISEHNKGIKYGDIDIVDLSNNYSLSEIEKILQLILCVIVNCQEKQYYISKIMDLHPQLQQLFAQAIQTAIQTRICSQESQQKYQLIQQIHSKQHEIESLYQQNQKLQQQNSQFRQKIQQYEKNQDNLQYQKQKIQLYKKSTNYTYNYQGASSSTLQAFSTQKIIFNDQGIYDQESILEQSFANGQSSLHIANTNTTNIIESLKQRLIKQQEQFDNQLQENEQKIEELQEKLKATSHYEELLFVYQQKYQQSLAFCQKLTLYQKQKNRISQQVIQKDYIIQELGCKLGQLNEKLVQVEQSKIDLQLLIAKKNNQNEVKYQKRQAMLLVRGGPIQNGSINIDKLDKENPKEKRHHRGLSDVSKKSREISQVPLISAIFHSELEKSHVQRTAQDYFQLETRIEGLNLSLKRLERKEKQLLKQNLILKQKLKGLKQIENENEKLIKIIVDLHSQKDQEQQLLVSALFETYQNFNQRVQKLVFASKGKENDSMIARSPFRRDSLRNSRRSAQNSTLCNTTKESRFFRKSSIFLQSTAQGTSSFKPTKSKDEDFIQDLSKSDGMEQEGITPIQYD